MVAARQPNVPEASRVAELPVAAGRILSARQVRAIRTAMQTFIEEDLAFGSTRRGTRWCVRCRAQRRAAGFVAYPCGDLCNDCATAYELARARQLVGSVEEFVERRDDA